MYDVNDFFIEVNPVCNGLICLKQIGDGTTFFQNLVLLHKIISVILWTNTNCLVWNQPLDCYIFVEENIKLRKKASGFTVSPVGCREFLLRWISRHWRFLLRWIHGHRAFLLRWIHRFRDFFTNSFYGFCPWQVWGTGLCGIMLFLRW